MRYLTLTLILLLAAACDFVGGAETLVRGSNNIIAADPDADMVAKALAEFESVPAVTDEELQTIYSAIRQRAAAGDLEAARVILRLAAIQRTPGEGGEPDSGE